MWGEGWISPVAKAIKSGGRRKSLWVFVEVMGKGGRLERVKEEKFDWPFGERLPNETTNQVGKICCLQESNC